MIKTGRIKNNSRFTLLAAIRIIPVLILSAWSITSTSAQANLFNDVSSPNKNFVAIQYLKQQNLIEGYADGSFKPDQEINRAEAIKMLLKAISGQETKNNNPFSFDDVKKTDWFYSYLQTAWDRYLVKGYPDKLFHPEKNINLAESLKITLLEEGKTIPTAVSTPPYTDVNITDWYAPYAQISKERTLFLESRSNGALNADTIMNRGSFAELIYRTIKSSEGSRFARATWYADLLAKQNTASGEPYEPDHFTVAHKTLPFGTKLLVTCLSNGKTVEVTVNDRGPYATGVDLDLSRSAFEALASTGTGIINVEYKEIPKIDQYGF
jgi:rare lipoprotein A